MRTSNCNNSLKVRDVVENCSICFAVRPVTILEMHPHGHKQAAEYAFRRRRFKSLRESGWVRKRRRAVHRGTPVMRRIDGSVTSSRDREEYSESVPNMLLSHENEISSAGMTTTEVDENGTITGTLRARREKSSGSSLILVLELRKVRE